MKRSLLASLLILAVYLLCGQTGYRQTFFIDGASHGMAKLIFYYGDQQILQDSGFVDISGKLVFVMNEQADPGMYRIELANKKGLDFLFNKEECSIATDQNFGIEDLVVAQTDENAVFFDYFRHKSAFENRIEILREFLKLYPSNDSFYNTAENHLKFLSDTYSTYLDSLMYLAESMFAGKVIRLDQLPDIRPGNITAEENHKYRSDYFSKIDLTDSLLLNTPYLPVKVIDYLTLYINPGASKDVQEQYFMEAVDSLMKFTEGGARVKEMIINYLIEGFQAYGFEKVMTYLVEKYVLGQQCVSDQKEEQLKFRIEGFKKLETGSQAPDFETVDSQGKRIRLSENQGRKTLLMFWAGNCPHCQSLLPELKKLYNQFGDRVRFIGISVDEDEKTWREALEKNQLPWPNIAELKGWDGRIVQDYYVYATPTFLVINSDMKIAAKPAGMAELRGVLMQ